MTDSGIDAQAALSQARSSELTQFKLRMDGLKQRLSKGPSEEEQLRSVCRDFEAVFIGKLWQEMRKSVPKEGYLHSKQEEMYTSMFDKEFSEQMADAGGIGLADILYDQLAQQLKNTSDTTLAANTTIKPLAEHGKPELKTVKEAHPDSIPLRGPEPEMPESIEPEAVGFSPETEEGAAQAAPVSEASEDLEQPVNESDLAAEAPAPRDVSTLSPTQVDNELEVLARKLRARLGVDPTNPGAVFDSARKGAFLGESEDHETIGRILAEI